MNFKIPQALLLKSLQAVIGVVERKQNMPMLNNILLSLTDEALSITATDLEVELVAKTKTETEATGEVTVPGRKLYDICRALPNDADIHINQTGEEKVNIKAGRSRFALATLKAADFPVVDEIAAQQTIKLPRKDLKRLLQKTHFAMAQQDVRYYLNGLCLETSGHTFRAVATDGHRLALSEVALKEATDRNEQVILPRKGVMELERLLNDEGDLVELSLGSNHARAQIDGIRFTSKLIDGRFPEYDRVLPKDCRHVITADRGLLRQALQRAAILSNEKYRGVRLDLDENKITIEANNPEQEEAEEALEVQYSGEKMEIGFNVNYLLDALSAVEEDQVELGLSDANSSCLIRAPGAKTTRYVVMPMRL